MSQNLLRRISILTLTVCVIFISFALFACKSGGNTDTTSVSDTDKSITDPSDQTTDPVDETTAESVEPDETPEIVGAPCDHISPKGSLKVTMTEIFKISDHTDSNNVHCRVVQGGCTDDGTYYYVALNNNDKTEASINAILKYEIATGTLVKVFENVKTSHCNDLTYNPETTEIFIVHNLPDRQHISVADPDTFEIKRVIELENLEIYSLSYDPYEKCYWAGISYGFDFVKLDLEFKQVGEIIKGVETGYTKQGMDLDERYLYFLQYNANSIIVYDKVGNFIREITLPKTSYEAENIFHIGDVFYIGYYKTKAGGMMYKTVLEKTSEYDASITLTEYKTVETYKDSQENTYIIGQGSCTDGKYLYLMMNNDLKEGYRSALHKIDLATGETVQIADGIDSGSSNDLTYNPKTKQIVVATDNPDKTRIVIIDAESMTVVKEKKLSKKVYSVAYDAEKGGYWFGICQTYDFMFLDENFEQVGDVYSGKNTGYTKQGMEYTGGYIYFLHSNKNAVIIYESDGTFAAEVSLPELNVTSAQNICCADGVFYIGCYVENVGCVIYKAEIKLEK